MTAGPTPAARRALPRTLESHFPRDHPNPEGRTVGIQHRPKSQRTRAKRRRKTRKHKLRSTKKYKIK